MINYWLSQSKSIRKDLFNLFMVSYLLYGDYGECTCWAANSSPPPTPKSQQCTLKESWRVHELLKTYFSQKRALPPKNMSTTRTHLAASVMLVGARVKEDNKASSPSASLWLSLRPAHRRAPSWEGPPHNRVLVLQVQRDSWGREEQLSGRWISQQGPIKQLLPEDYCWESEDSINMDGCWLNWGC